MKILLSVLMLLLTPAQLEHRVPDGKMDGWVFVTGNTLLEECRSNDDGVKLGCLRYITGVMDLIGSEQSSQLTPDGRSAWQYHFACMPELATALQVRDLIVRDLEILPETRDRSAASLIVISVLKVWRCPSK
jgi:hypothetical protein